jgi:hypothetical protein
MLQDDLVVFVISLAVHDRIEEKEGQFMAAMLDGETAFYFWSVSWDVPSTSGQYLGGVSVSWGCAFYFWSVSWGCAFYFWSVSWGVSSTSGQYLGGVSVSFMSQALKGLKSPCPTNRIIIFQSSEILVPVTMHSIMDSGGFYHETS